MSEPLEVVKQPESKELHEGAFYRPSESIFVERVDENDIKIEDLTLGLKDTLVYIEPTTSVDGPAYLFRAISRKGNTVRLNQGHILDIHKIDPVY